MVNSVASILILFESWSANEPFSPACKLNKDVQSRHRSLLRADERGRRKIRLRARGEAGSAKGIRRGALRRLYCYFYCYIIPITLLFSNNAERIFSISTNILTLGTPIPPNNAFPKNTDPKDLEELAGQHLGSKGSPAAGAFKANVYAVVSVSSGIEFLQQFGVFPQVGDYRFVVLHSDSTTSETSTSTSPSFRVLWAAFFADGMSGPRTDESKPWPFFVAFVTEELCADGSGAKGSSGPRCRYVCEPNREASLGKKVNALLTSGFLAS